jgi:hypothetical protein
MQNEKRILIMKKVLITTISVVALSFFVNADIVKETKSKPVLAAVVELSPFVDLAAKVNILGVTMSNPIVPTLALTSLQQALYNEYGQMRTDMPMFYAIYVKDPAYKVAATNDAMVDIDEIVETVAVYPLAEKPNSFALRNVGSRKNADGTLYIPATDKRTGNYTVAYSKNQKVAAFASNAAMANIALKDCESFYLEEKAKKNVQVAKMSILKTGLSFISSLYESSLKLQAKDKSISDAMIDSQLKVVKERLESYANFDLTIDVDSTGLVVKGNAKKIKGAKIPSYAGVKIPANLLDCISRDAKIFYSVNYLILSGCDNENAREMFVNTIAKSVDSLKQSKDMKYVLFVNKFQALLTKYAKEIPLPNKNHYRTGWLGMDKANSPYAAELEVMDESEKYYNVSLNFLDSLQKEIASTWPEYKVVTTGAKKGSYYLDWDSIVDLNGIQKGAPVPKELAVAKKKIKMIFGDSKAELSLTKLPNGMLEFFGNPKTKVSMEKGDAESRLAAALPEVVNDRPTSVLYLAPYAIIRDVVLPIVAKTAPKAERSQYEMMIKAMLPTMPNSALASAFWVDSDGSERAIIRITSNELKSLGTILNTLTSSFLSAPQGN